MIFLFANAPFIARDPQHIVKWTLSLYDRFFRWRPIYGDRWASNRKVDLVLLKLIKFLLLKPTPLYDLMPICRHKWVASEKKYHKVKGSTLRFVGSLAINGALARRNIIKWNS